VTPELEELLRRLALNDAVSVRAALGTAVGDSGSPRLDPKTGALVRVAALMAMVSPLASYQWAVDLALAGGATEDDLVDVLMTVAPIVGVPRLASAAPQLALALGYDVDPEMF
jgi:alkylhydroperoxidase/carboxymuconolactone decarboxylase family protein YurZ